MFLNAYTNDANLFTRTHFHSTSDVILIGHKNSINSLQWSETEIIRWHTVQVFNMKHSQEHQDWFYSTNRNLGICWYLLVDLTYNNYTFRVKCVRLGVSQINFFRWLQLIRIRFEIGIFNVEQVLRNINRLKQMSYMESNVYFLKSFSHDQLITHATQYSDPELSNRVAISPPFFGCVCFVYFWNQRKFQSPYDQICCVSWTFPCISICV